MKAKPFHHGNLREALIESAIKVVNEKGLKALSLRGIAQTLDVSPAARFRHFKNKDALIAAMVEKCSTDMLNDYELAVKSGYSDKERLSHACMGYLTFAEKKPHMFALIFIDKNSVFEAHDNSIIQHYGYQLFEKLISRVIPNAIPKNQHRRISISCWSLLHGFATLHMSGKLETTDYKKEHAIHSVIMLVQFPNNLYIDSDS